MDDGFHSLVAYGFAEAVGVVPSVAYEYFAAGMSEELIGGDHFVSLARCDGDVNRARFGIDNGVKLRGKTASRAAQSIAFDPPFPPAAS
ncbi:MAG: hypothetical protein P8Y29_10785 [Gemmatimonadota bacterium]